MRNLSFALVSLILLLNTRTNTAEAAVKGWISGNWAMSWNGAADYELLGPTSDRVCFLTGVYGEWNKYSSASIVSGNGNWWLVSSGVVPGPLVKADCLAVDSPADYTQEASWTQNQAPTAMMFSSSTDTCFLSGMSGHFAGGGENVHAARASWGTWYVQGGSLQQGVGAKARCVHGPLTVVNHEAGPDVRFYPWVITYIDAQYGTNPAVRDGTTINPLTACFLSGFAGKLENSNDYAYLMEGTVHNGYRGGPILPDSYAWQLAINELWKIADITCVK